MELLQFVLVREISLRECEGRRERDRVMRGHQSLHKVAVRDIQL